MSKTTKIGYSLIALSMIAITLLIILLASGAIQ